MAQNVQVVVFHRRHEWIYGRAAKKHSWLFTAARLWLGLAILFLLSFSHTFMHSRGSRKQLRDSHKKRTIVHRVYHFPRFFATQLSSPAGVSSFFEVTTHPVRRISSCGYLMKGGPKGEEKETLHYNYRVKKFKSLNIMRRATIQMTLKVEDTRICKCGGMSRVTARCLMHKHVTKTLFHDISKRDYDYQILFDIFSILKLI